MRVVIFLRKHIFPLLFQTLEGFSIELGCVGRTWDNREGTEPQAGGVLGTTSQGQEVSVSLGSRSSYKPGLPNWRQKAWSWAECYPGTLSRPHCGLVAVCVPHQQQFGLQGTYIFHGKLFWFKNMQIQFWQFILNRNMLNYMVVRNPVYYSSTKLKWGGGILYAPVLVFRRD